MKILMVLTSHDQLGNTGLKTGFWLEEFAAPYYVFKDAGIDLTLASPKGGQPPLDPKSDLPENQTSAQKRFTRWEELFQPILQEPLQREKVKPNREWFFRLSQAMSKAEKSKTGSIGAKTLTREVASG